MASLDDEHQSAEDEINGMAHLAIDKPAEPDSSQPAPANTPAVTVNSPTQSSAPTTTPNPAPQSLSPSPVISNNAPGFKYKYPQASPTPPSVDDVEWNKLFTAADSRFYNKAHKSAIASKAKRESGETYTLALQMLKEKREKAASTAVKGKSSAASAPSTPAPTTSTSTPNVKAPAAKKSQHAKTNKETPASSREITPATMDMAERIKTEGRARKAHSAAPSSEYDTPGLSPAPKTSTAAAGPPKQKPGPKKGTAGPAKKHQDKKLIKAQTDALLASTDKAGTASSSRQASQTPGPRNGISSADDSNDGGEYCICRGPDDHRMMVFCEGGCEDWYHCSCIGIDEADAKELLDRFICPKCKVPGKLYTTYKPMCRYYNVGVFLKKPACRKAARVTGNPPSKYCSDEHRDAFWVFAATQVRQDNDPSKGGTLNRAEVYAILQKCKNMDDFRALGEKPRLPRREGADPNRPAGLDYLTPEEEKEIENIKKKKVDIEGKVEGLQNQLKLLKMVIERSKLAAQHLKETKPICGYDNRVSFNEVQFEMWSKTAEGKIAMETGVLGPRTDQTKHINALLSYPGQAVAKPPAVPDVLNNICTVLEKAKCRHNKLCSWKEVHSTDLAYNMKLLREQLDRLTVQELEIIDDAETREATKGYYSDNVTIQLF